MVRRVILVLGAVVASYLLTAVSGYLLYRFSEFRTEAQLSVIVRFIFDPTIALIIGVLVGLFTRDHPAITAVASLAPWVLTINAPSAAALSRSPFPSIVSILVPLALGATAASFAWRYRQKRMRIRGLQSAI